MNAWIPLLAVALGGAAGAVARYGVSSGVARALGEGGWGTAAVNVAGAFLLGALLGATETRLHLSASMRTGLIVGVVGGFTTFSTFLWDAATHMEAGNWLSGTAVLAGSVAIGLVAMVVGLTLGRGL